MEQKNTTSKDVVNFCCIINVSFRRFGPDFQILLQTCRRYHYFYEGQDVFHKYYAVGQADKWTNEHSDMNLVGVVNLSHFLTPLVYTFKLLHNYLLQWMSNGLKTNSLFLLENRVVLSLVNPIHFNPFGPFSMATCM